MIIAVTCTVFGVLVFLLLFWFGVGCFKARNPTDDEVEDLEQHDIAKERRKWHKEHQKRVTRGEDVTELEAAMEKVYGTTAAELSEPPPRKSRLSTASPAARLALTPSPSGSSPGRASRERERSIAMS